jgi:hypothetical protein
MCLGRVVEELHGLDPGALSDSELAELLVGLTQVTEAAEAASLRTMGVFEGRQGPQGRRCLERGVVDPGTQPPVHHRSQLAGSSRPPDPHPTPAR